MCRLNAGITFWPGIARFIVSHQPLPQFRCGSAVIIHCAKVIQLETIHIHFSGQNTGNVQIVISYPSKMTAWSQEEFKCFKTCANKRAWLVENTIQWHGRSSIFKRKFPVFQFRLSINAISCWSHFGIQLQQIVEPALA